MSKNPQQIITRYAGNPILSATDIPYDASLIFNAGVTKYNGKYVMIFRNDYGSTEADWQQAMADKSEVPPLHTNIGLAFSDDGYNWTVQPKPCFELSDHEISRAYDPRLTVIDGQCYLCFAVDTKHGVRGGIATTEDFEKFDILSMSAPDNRNMVLFPEKINDKFIRLERPFPEYSRSYQERFDVWISASPDCRFWGETDLLLGVEDVSFCNSKLGPAAPPIKTEKGWLTTFHAVYKNTDKELYSWHDNWHKAYYGGLMLLDLENPYKVIGMCQEPLLTPETNYERTGFRGDVIFPGGMILEDSGEVKIYYGAADTVEAVATADVNDLLALCQPI